MSKSVAVEAKMVEVLANGQEVCFWNLCNWNLHSAKIRITLIQGLSGGFGRKACFPSFLFAKTVAILCSVLYNTASLCSW